MLPTSISLRCSVSCVALDITRIATAAETAYTIPMMASCGMRVFRWTREMAKIAAPRNVKPSEKR